MLKTLPILPFEKFHYLETLNLQSNRLRHVPEEAIAPFMDTLDFIDISRNPLQCDCDLAWYREWYEKRHRSPGGIGSGSAAVFAGPPETRTTAKCRHPNSGTEIDVHQLPLKEMGCMGKIYGSSPSRGSVVTFSPAAAAAVVIGTAGSGSLLLTV